MKTTFSTKNGSVVTIEIDEDNYTATVLDQAGTLIGAIECRLIEDPRAPDGYCLKMTNAFLEGGNRKYLHQGIGTRCIELLREETGFPICVAKHDGLTQADGSHLTGDAPAFADKLERLRLVFRR
ncbi:hypothetical protein [Yoonia sediminilitoris]|uniref:N-acetyltransferase domain-containing protein n=1 Tax=Yoonia sediminilitoris TaxID=1286148 RepID=A0A2T6K750_9RHOB|nr:hypothetical protein [Yoonia sediminilitoris]PUB10525.1 hypothetical protein C8N45_1184 [Yoonia sediminilitoris]RCW90095.1 hypothetical protein DFP92_11840 [Yoonia sediminilitoris]